MNAVGCWKMTMDTQVGAQVMHLYVATQDAGFSGHVDSAMGNTPVSGKVSGSTLNWVMQVTKPISLKVTFDMTVDGDRISGVAKLGIFGKMVVKGERVNAYGAGASVAAPAAAPQKITGDSVDPPYDRPYVDVNELRTKPVPHRYVHGGFTGTDARFSFYFPTKERYGGRFFQNTYPMATSEDIGPFPIEFDVAVGNLAFTIDSGAYYVQTNLGGNDRAGGMADPAIAAYRVNAAAAKYSRVIAAQLYGAHRPWGYIYGGSGGSYQVMGAAENTAGVWDGFVPYVIGTPNSIPSLLTVRMHALRVLRQRNKFPAIVDAVSPGGSGDPYAGLDAEERAALLEATRLGFPLRSWWNHEALTSGYFRQVAPIMPMLDPTYVDDFWSQPGYLGSDPSSSIHAARFSFDTTVARVIDGFPKQVELAGLPAQDVADAHLVLLSGESEGRSTPIATVEGHTVGFAFAADQSVINRVRAGDRVRIDNSWALALQTYQRHQLPDADLYAWNQYRDAKGEPLYPQREVLIGPIAAGGTAGSVPDGRISGKMLVLECLMDIDSMPWQADWYRGKVKATLGPAFEEQFAVWFIDHAQHDNPQTPKAWAHTVSFEGALQQALRDLSVWVEQGQRPAETKYRVADAQVELPASAAERGGIQPVVELKVNGTLRADVATGTTVNFDAVIEVPPGAGQIVALEWDFEGEGTFPLTQTLEAPQPQVRVSVQHRYDRSGTRFPVLRVISQRHGDAKTPYGRIENIARVRVVVG